MATLLYILLLCLLGLSVFSVGIAPVTTKEQTVLNLTLCVLWLGYFTLLTLSTL